MKTLAFTREGRFSMWAVLLNNAVITAGFIFLNWDLSDAVLIFWAEGVISGIFGGFKVMIRSIYELEEPDEGALFKGYLVSVIVIMYMALLSLMIFMTSLVLPVFVNSIADKPVIIYESGTDLSGYMKGFAIYITNEFFSLPETFSFYSASEFILRSKFLIVLSITAVQIYLFLGNFIRKKLFLEISLKKLIVRPTARFFMIYFLFGVIFLPFSCFITWDSIFFPVLLWITGKTIYDLYGGYIDIFTEEMDRPVNS